MKRERAMDARALYKYRGALTHEAPNIANMRIVMC